MIARPDTRRYFDGILGGPSRAESVRPDVTGLCSAEPVEPVDSLVEDRFLTADMER